MKHFALPLEHILTIRGITLEEFYDQLPREERNKVTLAEFSAFREGRLRLIMPSGPAQRMHLITAVLAKAYFGDAPARGVHILFPKDAIFSANTPGTRTEEAATHYTRYWQHIAATYWPRPDLIGSHVTKKDMVQGERFAELSFFHRQCTSIPFLWAVADNGTVSDFKREVSLTNMDRDNPTPIPRPKGRIMGAVYAFIDAVLEGRAQNTQDFTHGDYALALLIKHTGLGREDILSAALPPAQPRLSFQARLAAHLLTEPETGFPNCPEDLRSLLHDLGNNLETLFSLLPIEMKKWVRNPNVLASFIQDPKPPFLYAKGKPTRPAQAIHFLVNHWREKNGKAPLSFDETFANMKTSARTIKGPARPKQNFPRPPRGTPEGST